jgi:2-dehydro-3-deoxygluconokinase
VSTAKTYDFVSLGETMLALAPPHGVALRDAAALLVDHAGAESNTAVGLARLGHSVAWIGRLGADAAGDRILYALEAEGIDTRWVERDPRRATGVMLKDPRVGVRYYRTDSAASVMGPELLDAVPIGDARAALVTGVTALIGPRPQMAALAFLDRAHGLRIVDPNLRNGLWGSDRRAELLRPLVERSTLLLAGVDELAEIVGSARPGRSGGSGGSGEGTEASPPQEREVLAERSEAIARRATALGPAEIVVRGVGSVGALADGTWHRLDIARGDAVDPVGAGDAFNAGYIAVRLRGGSIDDALRAGVFCGTAVTGAVSDTSAFPRTLGTLG